jgi:hypothetical protein
LRYVTTDGTDAGRINRRQEHGLVSTYRLERVFDPRSVALVGASQREGALGRTVLRNLREAGFPGSILRAPAARASPPA